MKRESSSRRDFLLTAAAAGLIGITSRPSSAAPDDSHYARTVLAKKPVGYWRLGEDKGPDAHDNSGHGFAGTYQGTAKFAEKGAIQNDPDTAVKFDGKQTYVNIPSHDEFSQPTSGKGLTVEAWLRPDVLEFDGETANPYVHWIGKGENNQFEWALRFYSRASKDRPNRVSAYVFNADGGLGAGAYFQDTLTLQR